jgi:hypothetical protein
MYSEYLAWNARRFTSRLRPEDEGRSYDASTEG